MKPIRVAQFTIEGEYIDTFSCARAAWEAIGGPKCDYEIGLCCKLINKHCRGYRWLYEEDVPKAKEIFEANPIRNIKGYIEPTYTEEDLINEGKKYKTKQDFRNGSPKQWQLAYKRGIIKKIPFEPVLDPYRENIYSIYGYFFQETHSVYVGLTDCASARDYEHRKGKKKSAVKKHSEKYNLDIPEQTILEDGLYMNEVQGREDFWKKYWKTQGWNVLNIAPTGPGTSSMGSVKKVSDAHIRKCAAQCATKKEFREKFPKEFQCCRNRKNLYKSLELEDALRTPLYTFSEKSCYDTAKKYKMAGDFKEYDRAAYNAACRRDGGWLYQYWWLFNEVERPVIRISGFKIKLYQSVLKCAEDNCTGSNVIISRVKKHNSTDGYNYHYLDISDIDFKIPDYENRYIK